MTKYFTINNRRYEAKEFDINLVCDLSEMGVNVLNMSSIKDNPLSVIRSYVALCIGVDKDTAGEEIQAHIVNGGSFDEVLDIIREKLENSDFFQALNQGEEETTPKKKAKKTEESK